MAVASSFGQWLKQRRKAHDLTQERLAEQVGCSAEMIRKIEAGSRRPSREIAERMAQFLALAPDERAQFVQLARRAAQPAPAPSLWVPSEGSAPQPPPAEDVQPAAGSTGVERPAPPCVIPAPPTPLIGRERLIADAEALLRRDAVRLLTLTGSGGTGKTRVGLQLARNLAGAFANGAYFVALAPISDPEQIVPAIAQTLGVREEGGRPVFESLRAYLEGRHTLLVLDNFEQALGAAPAIGQLLMGCPQLKLLVTSRVRLQLYGEYELAVPPLELPASVDGGADEPERAGALLASEAVRLFLARAEVVRPEQSFAPDEIATIAAICARLDGLPLAIELAAARSKFFAPRALLAQLSSRLNTLVGGPYDLPARQRTLRDAIGWSFNLLSAEEQTVFAALGCFVGGFTMEAAAACAAPLIAPGAHPDEFGGLSPVQAIVTALVDKSLLRQEAGAAGEPRFSMLETIREYALEQLALRGMVEAQQQRHAAYFLALAEAAEPQLWSPQRQAAMELLELEYGNIRAALAWSQGPGGDPETALRMASALWWFWFMRSSMTEGQLWLTGALKRRDRTSLAAQAKALPRAGIQAWFTSDYARAEALCAEGVELNRQLGDRIGVAYGVHGLGLVALDRCEPRALTYFEECLGYFRDEGHIWGVAWSLFRLAQSAWVLNLQGTAQVLPQLEESHKLFQLVGDKVGVAHALYSLGAVARGQGDLARSRQRYEERSNSAAPKAIRGR